jgi:hypothetical protein
MIADCCGDKGATKGGRHQVIAPQLNRPVRPRSWGRAGGRECQDRSRVRNAHLDATPLDGRVNAHSWFRLRCFDKKIEGGAAVAARPTSHGVPPCLSRRKPSLGCERYNASQRLGAPLLVCFRAFPVLRLLRRSNLPLRLSTSENSNAPSNGSIMPASLAPHLLH